MTTLTAREPRTTLRPGFPPPFKKEGVVYAITFDLDIEQLRLHNGDPYNNAYLEIRRIIESHGFTWQQGSVYFGGPTVNSQTCSLVAIDLAQRLPWFGASVRDIRMLRIEEFNDLLPIIQRVASGPGGPS